MDSYCTKCSLQFGNMTVYNMHMSIVHKENVEIKQEPSCDTLEKEIEEPEKVPFQCQICEKAFSVYFLLFPYPKNFSQFFSSHWKK